MDYDEVAKIIKEKNIELLRLQFTDIGGTTKSVEIPAERLHDAIEFGICFDLSSISGGARTEESDARLKPDLSTFKIWPFCQATGRIICDVYNHNIQPFAGDPRRILKKQVERAAELGYIYKVGPEIEFFIFKQNNSTFDFLDYGGYFDSVLKDPAADLRAEILQYLHKFGISAEAAHHEVSPSQHEIDFKYSDALSSADNTLTLKETIKLVAAQHSFFATFMPKPKEGMNGSGMHIHQSLWSGDKNLFYDDGHPYKLSKLAQWFIGGQLKYIDEIVAVLAPTVNSYKRLIPGFEAPNLKCWGSLNRSALIRVPQYTPGKESSTRLELRCPDPTANLYLALAVILEAGLRGIEEKIEPPAPIEKDAFKFTPEEQAQRNITSLPGSLGDAIRAMDAGTVVKKVFGDQTYMKFFESKRAEWLEFRRKVHAWELEQYLHKF